MTTKIRRSQLEKMPRGQALQWIKKINPNQCDCPQWVQDIKDGKIKLEINNATIKLRKQLVDSLREKNRGIKNG